MNILIATDGSPNAQAAVQLTRQLPLANANVTVLSSGHVNRLLTPGAFVWMVPESSVDWYEAAQEGALRHAEQHARAAAEALQRDGWQVEAVARSGHPAELILEIAADQQADLIMLGSRGLGTFTGWLLGSVSHAVVAAAPCSVCVVRAHPREDALDDWQVIVLGSDGSADADAAAQMLLDLRLNERASLDVITVLPDFAWSPGLQSDVEVANALATKRQQSAHELVERVAAPLRPRFSRVSTHVREGDTGNEIIELARQNHADLVVVGTEGLSGLQRLLLGSVAQRVATYAPCSVLVVKRPGADAKA